MICDVPTGDMPRLHWWSRPSLWLWGLVILLVIVAIAAAQGQRLSALFSTRAPKSSLAAPATAPKLSGPAYTQATVAGLSFIRADLRSARLTHLDLRGENFRHAQASGALF